MGQTAICDGVRSKEELEKVSSTIPTRHTFVKTHYGREDNDWNERTESCLDRCDVELGMKEKRQEQAQASSFLNWPQIAFC